MSYPQLVREETRPAGQTVVAAPVGVATINSMGQVVNPDGSLLVGVGGLPVKVGYVPTIAAPPLAQQSFWDPTGWWMGFVTGAAVIVFGTLATDLAMKHFGRGARRSFTVTTRTRRSSR